MMNISRRAFVSGATAATMAVAVGVPVSAVVDKAAPIPGTPAYAVLMLGGKEVSERVACALTCRALNDSLSFEAMGEVVLTSKVNGSASDMTLRIVNAEQPEWWAQIPVGGHVRTGDNVRLS